MEGRLKQGIYPFRAPVGYRDQGRGKVKIPDPILAPIIVEAFRWYATGDFTLTALVDRLATLGLTKCTGGPITAQTLSDILRRRFDVGKFKIGDTTYRGQHQPLISRDLFNQVQSRLRRFRGRKRIKHAFLYSRRLRCKQCQYLLVCEKQKNHVYYRCHACQGRCLNETKVKQLENDTNAPFTVITPTRAVLLPYDQFDSYKPSPRIGLERF